MTKLLHIDSSLRAEGSTSRAVSASFAEHWRAANPDGTYRYRDLGTNPVPHLNWAGVAAQQTPADEQTEAMRTGLALSNELVDELRDADVLLLAMPMYNFSVPTSVRAWLDWIVRPDTMIDQETGVGALSGKRVIVVTARGGAYGPGTPREPFEFQERYLRAVFTMLGLADDLTFVNAELTHANIMPAMAQFKPLADEMLANAHQAARDLANAAAPLAA